MLKNKYLLPIIGLSTALSGMTVQAAPTPSVAGTTWNLKGSFGGSAKVSCKMGGSHSIPIPGKKKLTSTIQFVIGENPEDHPNEGTFTWIDEGFTQRVVTGTWEQNKTKLILEFDNWWASPVGAFGFGMAGVPSDFDFSKNGVQGSANGLKLTKFKVGGSVNNKGTQINVSESLGFKFSASGSAGGYSNSCSFSITSLGRSYKGALIPQ